MPTRMDNHPSCGRAPATPKQLSTAPLHCHASTAQKKSGPATSA